MTSIKDLMTPGVQCVAADTTLQGAAQQMRELNVGALPICGNDDRLAGMITDRDIVTQCIADGGDPSTVTVGSLAKGTPIWVDAGGTAEEALELMSTNQIRRLPVIEDKRIVGIVSQADLALELAPGDVGNVVRDISKA